MNKKSENKTMIDSVCVMFRIRSQIVIIFGDESGSEQKETQDIRL